MRKPRPQSAVQMLVDEEGPEKTRRAQSGQNVPGRGERQEKRGARKRAKLPPAMPSRRHGNERDNGARGEKQSNQCASQYCNGAQGGGAPVSHSCIETPGPGPQK